MIISPFKTLASIGGILGVTGLGTVGIYETTQKTISDSLGEVKIVSKDNNENIWEKLKKRLGDNEPEKLTPKSQIFIDLKDVNKTEEDLKNICQEVGKNIYWTIFSKDLDLMEDVKNFCAITMEKVLETGELMDVTKTNDENTDKEKFKTKLNTLKNHTPGGGSGELDGDLTSLKTKMNADDPDKNKLWSELREWCSKSYKSYFFNKSDDLWKNVDEYCKKTS